MEKIAVADCTIGYHHPPGHLDLCVPDEQNIPAVSDFGLLALSLMIVFIARRWC
jgi:hypothetical protein